jgi:hypothetical protein
MLGGYQPGRAHGYEVPLSIKGSLKKHPINPAETGFFSPLLGQACILQRVMRCMDGVGISHCKVVLCMEV